MWRPAADCLTRRILEAIARLTSLTLGPFTLPSCKKLACNLGESLRKRLATLKVREGWAAINLWILAWRREGEEEMGK